MRKARTKRARKMTGKKARRKTGKRKGRGTSNPMFSTLDCTGAGSFSNT